MKNYLVIIITLLLLIFTACGGGSRNEYEETPIDKFIKKYGYDEKIKTFSVTLKDMDLDENTDIFKHKYQLVFNPEDSTNAKTEETDWYDVSPEFFNKHVDNLGMELLSKTIGEDGRPDIEKTPAPPGYKNYVGNEKYGQWKTDNNGNSFWAFYGQYMFMSTILNMASGPIYRRSYMDYDRNYRGSSAYYGSGAGGTKRYGTGSSHAQKSNPNFHQRRMNKVSNFKRSYASNPSRYRSSSGSRSRSYSRSRGGRFGK